LDYLRGSRDCLCFVPSLRVLVQQHIEKWIIESAVQFVDAWGPHATFYGYDQEGRVCETWNRSSANGFGPSMQPRRPQVLTLERDGASQQPIAKYQYNVRLVLLAVALHDI